MFSTLRTRFGIPGVISVIALVFAMLGGAYAASNGSSGGKATASAKPKRGPKGPRGATGPAGPQGPVGPQGAAGANGKDGGQGAEGKQGPEGKEGKQGKEGKEGKQGPEGKSGFTKTLPSGETETGAWAITSSSGSLYQPYVAQTSVSFPIPLAAPGGEESAVGFTQSQTSNEEFGLNTNTGDACTVEVSEPLCVDTGCRGTVSEPTAPPGKLCLYTSYEESVNTNIFRELQTPVKGQTDQYGTSGAILFAGYFEGAISPEEPGWIEAYGSWAVTAP